MKINDDIEKSDEKKKKDGDEEGKEGQEVDDGSGCATICCGFYIFLT